MSISKLDLVWLVEEIKINFQILILFQKAGLIFNFRGRSRLFLIALNLCFECMYTDFKDKHLYCSNRHSQASMTCTLIVFAPASFSLMLCSWENTISTTATSQNVLHNIHNLFASAFISCSTVKTLGQLECTSYFPMPFGGHVKYYVAQPAWIGQQDGWILL